MKVELSKSQIELLEMGTKIKGQGGTVYYFLPYWYKSTNQQGVYEEINWDELPEGIKKYIENQRNK